MGESYEIQKLGDLIDNYLSGDDIAGVRLAEMEIIDGEDLIRALDYLGLEHETSEKERVLGEKVEKYSERIKKYHTIIRELEKSKSKKILVNKLESVLYGKSGRFIDKIKAILNESKQEWLCVNPKP